MKEQIVLEHVAILAKEIGFDEPCLYWYGEEDTWGQKSKLKEPISLQTHRNSKAPSNTYSAPTQSFLQKWLREVHNLIVIIYWGPFSKKYSYEIYHNGKDYCVKYDTYEEALEDGLIEALELIQQQ